MCVSTEKPILEKYLNCMMHSELTDLIGKNVFTEIEVWTMSTEKIILDRTSEPILLAMIDEYSRLPGKKDDRYWQLRGKREDKTLTIAESAEYESLIKEWETRNVERVRALIALAKKRDTTLHGVMAQLGLKGTEDDF